MVKLGNGATLYNKDTTLAGLWRAWMRMNKLDLEAAQAFLKKNNIRCNLEGCLKNEYDDSVLARFASAVLETTGVDFDRWMVLEAKRQAIAAYPHLADKIFWDKLCTRQELVEEIAEHAKLYGGTWYVGIQMRIPPAIVNIWTRPDNNRMPTIDRMKEAFRAIAEGLLVDVSCQEDVMFALMVRTLLCEEVARVISYASFKEALDAFFKPYTGWTTKKIAGELGVLSGMIDTMRDWQPRAGKKSTLYHESVELVLRTLIGRAYPELVDPFIELCKEYRSDEERGIWSVKQPLRLLENERVVETEKSVEKPVVKLPEPVRPPSGEFRLLPPVLTTEQKLAKMLRYGADLLDDSPEPVRDVNIEIGETLGGIRHCLTQHSFRPNPDGRISQENVQAVASTLRDARKILILLAQLDPEYLRREVNPVLTPELCELIIGFEGLRHLLGTNEAWEVIEGMRSGMSSSFVRNRAGGG